MSNNDNFDDSMFDSIAPQGTIEVVLQHVRVRSSEEVVLTMRHLGASNPGYVNARRKLDVELRSYGDSVPNGVLRDRLIPLVAQHGVTGWKHVIGADGKPVPYTAAEGERFLCALAKRNPDKVDQAIILASPADHFRPAAVEALGNG
jgi:hypothetical protein